MCYLSLFFGVCNRFMYIVTWGEYLCDNILQSMCMITCKFELTRIRIFNISVLCIDTLKSTWSKYMMQLTNEIFILLNSRYLLINISVGSVFASFYILVKSIYTLSFWIVGHSCALSETFRNCKYHETLLFVSKLPVLFTTIGLAIERW